MSIYLTFRGETHNITQWARKSGIHKVTLQQRLARGWSIDRALMVPTQRHGNYCKRDFERKVMPALIRYVEQHRDAEREFMKVLRDCALVSVKLQDATLSKIDMTMIGQPPAGTFKTPGVVFDFAETTDDRSLPATRGRP